MHVTNEVFGKICLKVIRDTFCPICGPRSGEGQGAGRTGHEENGELNFLVGGFLEKIVHFIKIPG